MWLRCCGGCCCLCMRRCGKQKEEDNKESTRLDSSSSLIHQEEGNTFYVPRRHSSFMPSSSNSSLVQSERPLSDCSSSSDEEGMPPEQRNRCWSTVPALETAPYSRNRTDKEPNSPLVFDRHVLSEIAEAEQSTSGQPRVDAEIYGYLTFTTHFDKQEQRLTVFLKGATGLPKKGDEEAYGTFVKMSLTSSGNNNFRLSRAVRKTLEPHYSEEHVFHTNKSKWKSSRSMAYLRLSVFDSDRQGRHDAIGHALLPLDEIGSDTQEHRLPLTPMSLPVPNLGQILVGLLYAPTQSRLSVHVIKARHLRLDAEVHKRHLRPLNRDVIDSFCKVTLTCGGQKVKTCRSRAVTGRDPFFNFRTSFVVPPQYLRDTGTIVSVVARSTLGRQGATLGRAAVLGPYVEMTDGSVTQWGKMIQEGRSIVQWRNLYL